MSGIEVPRPHPTMISRPPQRVTLPLRPQAAPARPVSVPGRVPFAGTRRALLVLAAIAAAVLVAPAAGQPGEDANEYEVKAAFLHKFTKYVTWPDDAFERTDSPFVVAVVGKDPFGAALDEVLADKAVGTHEIEVHRFESVRQLGPCHVLFVPASEASHGREIAARYRNQATVIVGESTGFARKGGIINFYLEGKNLRFEINVDASARSGVTISSQLLKHARIVHDEDAIEVPPTE